MIRPNEAHPPVSVGDLVSYKPAYGRHTQSFVVAAIERDGCFYELDLIGADDGKSYGAAWRIDSELSEYTILSRAGMP